MSYTIPPKDPLNGKYGHLDPGQQHHLSKFKKELEADGLYTTGPPPSHDDACLLRFLRARKFDVAKAKLMFTESERWRREFKVDELYRTFDYQEKEEVDKVYPQFYHKTDKDGRPVYIEQLGNLDLNKLYQVTTPERQLQRLVVEYEKFQRERLPVCTALRNDGELIETSCTIMDLDGVGISQFWKVKTYVQQASQVAQDYYPETMGKFYIINAPYLFSTVWSFVKPWLDEVTVRKISILDHYKAKAALLEQIPPENLPYYLGGVCDCPEGCSLSDAGPWRDVKEGKLQLTPGTLEAAAGADAAKAITSGEPVAGSGVPSSPATSTHRQPVAAAAPPAHAHVPTTTTPPSQSNGSVARKSSKSSIRSKLSLR